MRRRKKQIKAATMLQIGIAGVLLIVLVMFLVWYSDGLNSFKPDENTFQFIAGAKVERSGDATYRNKEGVIEIADANGKSNMAGNPILYEDTAKITLSDNMLLMIPTEGKDVSRVNCFATITEKGGLSTITMDRKQKQVRGGFLYNGEDTYILLEEATLVIGAKEVELGPLSYVTVAYRQYVEYHNSADNEYEWIALDNVDVTGKAASGYLLDFGKDVINTGDGEALLFSAVDSVSVIKMGN